MNDSHAEEFAEFVIFCFIAMPCFYAYGSLIYWFFQHITIAWTP